MVLEHHPTPFEALEEINVFLPRPLRVSTYKSISILISKDTSLHSLHWATSKENKFILWAMQWIQMMKNFSSLVY